MINRSCETCRVKKLRCHGGEPCGPCSRSGSECVRLTRKKKVMKKKAAAAVAAAAALQRPAAPMTSLGESSRTIMVDDGDLLWLTQARDAIGFSLEACQMLLNMSFRFRVLPYLHGCIDMDMLQSHARRLFDAVDKGVVNAAPPTRDQVMLLLFILSATLIFTPPNGRNAEPLKWAIAYSPRRGKQKLDPGARQRDMYALAMARLQRVVAPSIEAVQSVICVTLHDCEPASTKEELFDCAVRWCLQLDLHQSPEVDDIPTRIGEVRVRTWWYFVTRSWLSAPKQWSYALHSSLFTTRKPLAVELDDLEHGWDVQSASGNAGREWTTAAYSLSLLALAETVRGLVDARNERGGDQHFQDNVAAAFDKLQASLPWIHATDTPFSAEQAVEHHPSLSLAHAIRIEMERWLLHQQLFHCFLALNNVAEPTIGAAEMIPSSCTALARRMLASLEGYSRHCSVLAASRLPVDTLTSAATVIAVDTINHARHIDAARLDDFVTVAVAAGKARRLANEGKAPTQPRRRLLRLESLVEFWRESLPQEVLLEATMKSTGGLVDVGGECAPEQHLTQHVQSAIDESYDRMRALHAPAAQLWDSNESWRSALRWDNEGGASIDPRHTLVPNDAAATVSYTSASTLSEPSSNPTPPIEQQHMNDAPSSSWQADYSASMVPGLAALLPAFQFEKDDGEWWDRLSLSLQQGGGGGMAAAAM